MKKTKAEIISIIEELILYCEKEDKKSMREVYESVKNDLKDEKIQNARAKELCDYFCGYHAHAYLSDYEYVRVKKIIDFFWI